MRWLRGLSLASAIGAWTVIVVGGYVSATGSGLGCPGLILCGDAQDPVAAVIESSHRIAAWVEGFLVLAMFVLVILRYRAWRSVLILSSHAFVLLVAQSLLGILAVATTLNPLVVTAHLGLATAFLAVTVLNVAMIFRGSSPTPSRATPGVGPAIDTE